MQKAEQILQAMRKMGEKRIPLIRVYRSLFSEDLFLAAYDKIARNHGALTVGTENDTVDGMNLSRIRKIIEQLRSEHFRFHPTRRIRIPKKSGGTRPLGLPNFTDKLVQEVLRMVLEAYYEPRFRDCSHGFRPGHGCHTALTNMRYKFKGAAWFIEGDIRGCFDNIDHETLMAILARDIQQYTRGKQRAPNQEYYRLKHHIQCAREAGDQKRVRELELKRRTIPSGNVNDPNFRRLQYIRYADDFILSFIGHKSEAEAIKIAVGMFLKKHLHLELSASKTLITHARTEHARFLEYDINVCHEKEKIP